MGKKQSKAIRRAITDTQCLLENKTAINYNSFSFPFIFLEEA